MQELKCPGCGETKPEDGFHRNSKRKNGRASWCKACMAANHKAKYKRTVPERPDEPSGHKWCPRCEQVLPFPSFNKNKSARLGLSSWCRQCLKARHKERQETDEQYRKMRAESFAKTKERPEYWEQRKEYARQPEVKEAGRRWRLNQSQEKRDEWAERSAKWYQDNPERVKEYRRNNPQVKRVSEQKRRAAKKSALSKPYTTAEFVAHMAKFPVCYMCGCEYSDINPQRPDHLKPFGAGGSDSLGNQAGICAACNAAKSDIWPVLDCDDIRRRGGIIAARWESQGIAWADRYHKGSPAA